MKLQELASALLITHIHGNAETDITGIEADSRKIKPGYLFLCIPGLTADGHDYAPKAIALGASALVTERVLDLPIPQLVVKDARYAMAVLSAHFYGYPSKEMKIIGFTGTNGKTTSTYLLERILRDQGFVTGLMGTIEMKIGDTYYEMERTTQEAVDLQSSFRKMCDQKTDYCLMEVSSHALELGRVKGIHFRSGIFTNLSQDHLDYHGTMEAYAAAKGLLFSRLGNGFSLNPEERQYAILNADDAASLTLSRLTAAQIITYGIENHCDVRATDIQITSKGTSFKLVSFAGEAYFQMKLVGKFNVYNALGAIASALAENVPLEAIRNSLESIAVVDGRMEVVNEGQEFLVLVDYAHTPDGLENALSTIAEFAEGKVITVFGCGGDRDKTKRPIMGKVTAAYSDLLYVTSDNPRTEDPAAILEDIRPGLEEVNYPAEKVEFIVDRKKAIQKAIDGAGPKDVILIAGKGHETYQDIMGVKHDFDDRLVAKAAIRGRGR
ncbi:UDP-N-acetylmuramoyl-L-alanyl-D-glutamate--2,6-diaminopimelate ligase [Paenibacillus marchantiophytorum]|uniref:UDP-N-acetylmuramoyl-L-alanyl-D-glutamate--2,6-diaminopimelate ligase n=1 Tax=Paenibacillus marchantiophytorum TaxID=1619310 RepID=A0ABQ2BMQ8_9BACL|nr:UDP-N-acetylmuramoyl-L-alanyl-D-glutamate--2,6-diaminopimelate ligase [Paenibacillus marchantiophytorum]GGI43333.1 UDP-N-acetylmuramoyl-L-alanyl-D-glutamate--2,6-diaminopimelate ligase [Paenibacillus marchantiophytorum]